MVRKVDTYHVSFDFPRFNAVGDRIFDGIPMLPRHLLERRMAGRQTEGRVGPSHAARRKSPVSALSV